MREQHHGGIQAVAAHAFCFPQVSKLSRLGSTRGKQRIPYLTLTAAIGANGSKKAARTGAGLSVFADTQ